MAEEKILQDILSVMEREAASQRSRPVKLGNAAVGQQIEQLANAGKVAGILLSIKDDFLAIPEAITEIPEAVEESTEVREEQVNVFESLKDNINSIGTGLGKFTKAVTVDLADNLKNIGESLKEGAKKTGKFVLTVVAIAGIIALAVKFFEGFFKTEGTLADKIKGGFMSILDLLPEPIRNEIIDVFNQIKKELAPYVEEIKQILAPIWEEVKLWFNETLLPELKQAFSYLIDLILEEAEKLKKSATEFLLTGDADEPDPNTGKPKTGTGVLEGESGAKIGAIGGVLAGAAIGARVGATIGSVVPGAGTLIGALIGGGIGAAIGFMEKDEFFVCVEGGGGDAIIRTIEPSAKNIKDFVSPLGLPPAAFPGGGMAVPGMMAQPITQPPPDVEIPTNTNGAVIEAISERLNPPPGTPSTGITTIDNSSTSIDNRSTTIVNNENNHPGRGEYGY